MEHTGDMGSTSRRTEASSSVDCWLVSMWAVVERNGGGANGTTDGVDSTFMRSEPSPPLCGLAVNPIRPKDDMGGGSSAVCIEGIAG